MNNNAKKILREEFGIKAISVRRGRGTAYGWLDITVDKMPEGPVVEKIEKRLVELKCCGQYFSDSGPGDDWCPEVSWRLADGRMA